MRTQLSRTRRHKEQAAAGLAGGVGASPDSRESRPGLDHYAVRLAMISAASLIPVWV